MKNNIFEFLVGKNACFPIYEKEQQQKGGGDLLMITGGQVPSSAFSLVMSDAL